MEENFSFRERLREGEINEMSPVRMIGNAPFESLGNSSKSTSALNNDFYKIEELDKEHLIYKHKKLDLIIVVRKYTDLVFNEERWALIAELSFKSTIIKSSNNLINNKEAVHLNTINVREADRKNRIGTRLYLLLAERFLVISDSVQYEGAVELWKSFTKIPDINVYIWNEKEDKIISKMTAKTHDNAIWSNGELGDYSKMSTKLILTLT